MMQEELIAMTSVQRFDALAGVWSSLCIEQQAVLTRLALALSDAESVTKEMTQTWFRLPGCCQEQAVKVVRLFSAKRRESPKAADTLDE